MANERTSTAALWGMTLLRLVVGWHFLYEGLWKFAQSGWSAVEYLRLSRWIGAPLFQWIAENPSVLKACDRLTMWGLVLIGLGLMSGVLARIAAAAGILMLAFFYVAQPPFLTVGGAHHFLLLDYNVVEAVALVAVACCPGAGLWTVAKAAWARLAAAAAVFGPHAGLWTLVKTAWAQQRAAKASGNADVQVSMPERREVLAGLTALPVSAAFAAAFAAKHGTDAFAKKSPAETVTNASYRFKYQGLSDLKKKFTHQLDIKGVKMSRITLGGNLIGGWSHSRDLGYVATLMKAYNTPRRIYDTMHLAEACGVDTISTNPSLMNFITTYWKEEGGKMQFVSDCGHKDEGGELGIVVGAKKSVDAGASLIYIHGFGADEWACKGDWKTMEKALKEMRKLGVPVGIGAHAFGTLKFCVEHDLIPDFWMKTFHPGGYWSAQKTKDDAGEGEPGSNQKGWHDNNWCRDPQALSDWFQNRPEPWIAFKTMAAGAVHPRQSIPFVFNGGADAACMGMFDFQVVEDVNLANDAFDKGFRDRRRPWVGGQS